jgi:hypothetical protein
MDLRQIGRAVAAHKLAAILGLTAAVAFAFLAYVRVSPFGDPVLSYRKQSLWSSAITIQLTQRGFPEGRVIEQADRRGALVQLAPLYARLADTAQVRKKMRKLGSIEGKVSTVPLIDENRSSLPLVQISSLTDTKASALERVSRQADAFIGYIAQQQAANHVTPANRVLLKVVNGPTTPEVVVPRKITLPVVVFLSMLIVTGGLILALENTSTRGRKFGELDGEARAPLEALKLPVEDAPELEPRPTRSESAVAGQAAAGQALGNAARPGPVRTLHGQSGQDTA